MGDVVSEIRAACAAVAARARHVAVCTEAIVEYAAGLSLRPRPPEPALVPAPDEDLAAFWLALDAVNFGSGWFPTLRKDPGRSGYGTIAGRLKERFDAHGPWRAGELAGIDARRLADTFGQDPGHELMELYARSLRDLGARVLAECDGRFTGLVEDARGSAVALVERLAGWDCFADVSSYDGLAVPFLKRAQIAAADLSRAGVAEFHDLGRLTMFADNLVPHVLRLDGVLRFDEALVARIEREELIEHGSPEEVEIRACAVQAVELIVAERGDTCAAVVDEVLWRRGSEARYKAVPRHRSRCTAY